MARHNCNIGYWVAKPQIKRSNSFTWLPHFQSGPLTTRSPIAKLYMAGAYEVFEKGHELAGHGDGVVSEMGACLHISLILISMWVAARQNQQNDLCAQQRLRSAASAQSDQSSLCAQCVAKGPSFHHGDSKDSEQTGRMHRLIWVFTWRTCHFVGFIVRRLMYFESEIQVISVFDSTKIEERSCTKLHV